MVADMKEQLSKDQRGEFADTLIGSLPKVAQRVLVYELRKAPGIRLADCWYEYPRQSNFDKFDRQRLRDAAEEAGLLDIRAHVTEFGHQWAEGKSV